MANFLLNEPIISAFGNTQQVVWATIIWYLIFYCPFDLMHRMCTFMPFKIILYCINEVYLCKLIYQGITHATKIFPNSYFIMALIGIVKGNGPGFTRMFERLIRGTWSMSVIESMHPSYSTKISAIATTVFIVNKHSEWFMISQSFVFYCVVSVCIYFRLSAILLELYEPFSPFESLISFLLFGGIWDALSRAITLDEKDHSQMSNLKMKALRANVLTKNIRQPAEKPQTLTKVVL